VIAVVETAAGRFSVDLETDEVESWDGELGHVERPSVGLPRVVATAAAGSTVVALVDAKPPLLVSHDLGATWREAGRGLPPGRTVAVSADDPDVIVYAARNRLYLSRNGGVFWAALAVELPEIAALAVL
jgi:hypothetical protein